MFDRLSLLLRSLKVLSPPPGAWDQVAEARFTLARQGAQLHILDLLIAVTALHAGHSLITRDRDFAVIARVIPLEVEVF